ncbi:unnamed protein product [Linum tenue]|uniref:HMA domain-containing protein n=1 Tax=Linum tenue TaxID=586396 RepID=A0AAV0MK67_9ROSI|nr:unnamed protein product [Linum tenue]
MGEVRRLFFSPFLPNIPKIQINQSVQFSSAFLAQCFISLFSIQEEKKPAAAVEGEKKAEEKKGEEEKKKEDKPAEKKEGGEEPKVEEAAPPPPPPQEIVLKVYMHCEGCARKVRRCLKGFDGVEDVMTDCKTSKVVVKGEKADPLKVLDRIQRKSHRQVELISPIPKPPSEDDKKKAEDEKPKPPQELQPPPVITVVLQVYMHCEACAMEIKKRILRMKGVESAEADLKSSQVTVKGVLEAEKLVEYVHKRTGKHALIVKQEPEKKEESKGGDEGGKESKEEKKGDDAAADVGGEEKDKKEGSGGGGEDPKPEEKKEGESDAKAAEAPAAGEETKVVEVKRDEYIYYPPRSAMELYAYPPQIFSDENPNACAVM